MLFTAGMQCARIHTYIAQTYTDTYVRRAVHTFDPDKGKSMRFLSRVHSRRASPTVLNLMELEYAKMREDDLAARGEFPEFSPILPIYLKIVALILTRGRITDERYLNIKLRILLKLQTKCGTEVLLLLCTILCTDLLKYYALKPYRKLSKI